MKETANGMFIFLVGAIFYGSVVAQSTPLNVTGTYNHSLAGDLTLTQSGSSVAGIYEHGKATLRGTLGGTTLTGTYDNRAWSAKGTFELVFSDDGQSFSGRWKRLPPETLEGTWRGTKVESAKLEEILFVLANSDLEVQEIRAGRAYQVKLVFDSDYSAETVTVTLRSNASSEPITVQALRTEDKRIFITRPIATVANTQTTESE